MPIHPDVARPPNQRSYSLEGLPDREVLVFKSMVRLLGHRSQYVWLYSPLSTELRVIGEGSASLLVPQTSAQQVLTLGTANTRRQSYLQVPLHANELQAELDRLGALIAPAVSLAGAHTAQTSHASSTTPMRMLRWPPATLLTTATRLRLATLMAGKPLTLSELHQRSQENLAVCTAFFADLERLHLLAPASVSLPPSTALPAASTTGVSTGVSTALPTSTTALNSTLPMKPIAAKPGLLERIRVRLGLQTTSASGQTSRI